MKKERFLLSLLSLFVSIVVTAQSLGIKGTVTDVSGDPVIGASVIVKGQPQKGAITNVDGEFTLDVAKGTPLVISYLGYASVEMLAVDGMTVVLKEDTNTLNDVVVIGYGVQKKSVVTASIAKVSSDDLDGKTRLRAEDALKGMAAGVNVTSASGQPGSMSMIRIRGIGTINRSIRSHLWCACRQWCDSCHHKERQDGQGIHKLQFQLWLAKCMEETRRDRRHGLCNPSK